MKHINPNNIGWLLVPNPQILFHNSPVAGAPPNNPPPVAGAGVPNNPPPVGAADGAPNSPVAGAGCCAAPTPPAVVAVPDFLCFLPYNLLIVILQSFYFQTGA